MFYAFKFQSKLGLLALVVTLLFGITPEICANVVRPMPDFGWVTYTGATEKASRFRGQAVVVLVAPSPRDRRFRSQVGQLQKVFQRLSATGAVCVAAFTGDLGQIRSNIPFALAQDGPRVAYNMGIESGFAIAVVGKDGNLDSISTRVLSGQRVLDLIGNSFAVQQALRRD